MRSGYAWGDIMKGALCNDTRPCFARMTMGRCDRCSILIGDSYRDGACPFCKPHRDITGTVQYDWRPQYELRE